MLTKTIHNQNSVFYNLTYLHHHFVVYHRINFRSMICFYTNRILFFFQGLLIFHKPFVSLWISHPSLIMYSCYCDYGYGYGYCCWYQDGIFWLRHSKLVWFLTVKLFSPNLVFRTNSYLCKLWNRKRMLFKLNTAKAWYSQALTTSSLA